MNFRFFQKIIYVYINKKIFLIAIFILVLAFVFYNFHLIKVKDTYFLAEKAISSREKERGLAGRKKIFFWNAMIFEFKEKNKYSFWMKGMFFDLDILWIADGKIVAISKNVPFNFSKIITPNVLADKVLEIKAGTCDRKGIELGDEVKIF